MTAYVTYTTSGGGIIPTGEQGSANAGVNQSFTAGFTFNGYAFLPNSLNAAGSRPNAPTLETVSYPTQ